MCIRICIYSLLGQTATDGFESARLMTPGRPSASKCPEFRDGSGVHRGGLGKGGFSNLCAIKTLSC